MSGIHTIGKCRAMTRWLLVSDCASRPQGTLVPNRATLEGETQAGVLGAATGQAIIDADVGPGDRIGAVAMQAAKTSGVAASVAVSAPIAVFEPTMRQSYGVQVERLGRAAGDPRIGGKPMIRAPSANAWNRKPTTGMGCLRALRDGPARNHSMEVRPIR